MDKEQSSNRQRAFLFLVLFIWYILIFKHILPPPPTSHTHFEDTNLGAYDESLFHWSLGFLSPGHDSAILAFLKSGAAPAIPNKSSWSSF